LSDKVIRRGSAHTASTSNTLDTRFGHYPSSNALCHCRAGCAPLQQVAPVPCCAWSARGLWPKGVRLSASRKP